MFSTPFDLLFERRRDRLADHLRGSARIARADDDGRRRDLGILRNRQREISDAADQRDEDRDDDREDRPVDEKVRQLHCAVT
jgi:hypothetical protein